MTALLHRPCHVMRPSVPPASLRPASEIACQHHACPLITGAKPKGITATSAVVRSLTGGENGTKSDPLSSWVGCREEPGDCTHMCHPSAYQYWIYAMVKTLKALPPDARASAQRHLMRPARHLTSERAEPALDAVSGQRVFPPLH